MAIVQYTDVNVKRTFDTRRTDDAFPSIYLIQKEDGSYKN